MRWSLKLQNLDFTVEHKPGSTNTAVDCLSRRPYKPEQEEGEQNPRELEDISDPREIIEITFDESMIKQVDNLEENVDIQATVSLKWS